MIMCTIRSTLCVFVLFIALLMCGCVTVPEPHPYVPSTISHKSQAFLAISSAVPDGDPQTMEAWKRKQLLYDVALEATIPRLRIRYNITEQSTNIANVPVIIITPDEIAEKDQDTILIYIHGGAYAFGSAKSTIGCSGQMAHFSGLRVISIDYRLAPEHPFPAGLNDCLAVYRELVKTYNPSKIGIYGDSAGGALVLATTILARDEGLPMPAAVALLSPWADITKTGDTYHTLEGIDPVLYYDLNLRNSATAYAGEHNMKDPRISPVYADYSPGFPPTLIQVGTREIFLSNCARLQRKMLDAGVDVQLTLWEGMWHVFQYLPPLSKESREAYIELSKFFHAHLK
jgi:acetyl esterase/lipase